jgi:alcohol oxidase
MSLETESFDDFVRGDPEVQKAVYDEWNLKGTGPLSTNGIEAGVKIRPTEEELKEIESWPTPHFKSGWESYFKNKPDKPVMHYSVIAGYFPFAPLSEWSLIRHEDGSVTIC